MMCYDLLQSVKKYFANPENIKRYEDWLENDYKKRPKNMQPDDPPQNTKIINGMLAVEIPINKVR